MESQQTQPAQAAEETILSFLHKFSNYDAWKTTSQPKNLHPFAPDASEPPLSTLRSLESAAATLSSSLTTYLGTPFTDPKLVSLLRQHGQLSNGLYTSEHESRSRIDTFRKLGKEGYGEDVPLESASVIHFCVDRIEHWGKAAGMEIFKEEEKEKELTIVLGGKMLVVDIDLTIDRTPDSQDPINVARVKTSCALPSATTGNAVADGSDSLNQFIAQSLRDYFEKVRKAASVRDTVKATNLAKKFTSQLEYLMQLDQLALQEGDMGIRWFNDMGTLTTVVDRVGQAESNAIAQALSNPKAPLDIFLLRAHALPMPYLTSPSMDFLVHLSPLAYLSLLRSSPTSPVNPQSSSSIAPNTDIPLSHLRLALPHTDSRPNGVTIATLTLDNTGRHDAMQPFHSMSNRPSFQLPTTIPLSDVDHTFPELLSAGMEGMEDDSSATSTWVLDFTDGGSSEGIVMSQSRIREIEILVNPLSAVHESGVQMSFISSPSWVDLLLDPSRSMIERYVSTYTSPSSAHPPLALRLTTPSEPGFFLGRVPVRTMKQVWGILEIVREQCWINEVLTSATWTPETATAFANDKDEDEGANEQELEAAFRGTLQPRRIPVNVFIPNQSSDSLFSQDNDFDALGLGSMRSSPPRLLMTVQTRGMTPSQLHISVCHDPLRPRGVRVDVNGSLPFTADQVTSLEEFVRRGGALGLPGKLWAWHLS